VSGTLDFMPMSEADLEWVVDNERELHPYPWSYGNFVDSLAAGYSSWVMRDAGKPVGYAVMLLVLDEAHLLNISVIRARHGNGLGAALLAHLFGEAQARGATQFFLEVRPSNARAIALYRRIGFTPIGRRNRYYPAADGGREDAIVMRLDL
jgi:[ribosomal protein S18]-alanine N-acetyltransferase